jgi:hypothetical protein
LALIAFHAAPSLLPENLTAGAENLRLKQLFIQVITYDHCMESPTYSVYNSYDSPTHSVLQA